MKRFLLGALLLVLPSALVAADEIISDDLYASLVARREAIKEWAMLCPPGPYEGQYSTMDGVCHQGDMVCFAGLSCLAARLAGDDEYADARADDVRRAQSSSGQWFRGPMWVDKEYPGNDFSRDQTRGIFAYLLADGYVSQGPAKYARAVLSAERWMQWVASNDDRICLDDSRTCELTVGTHNMMYNTFRELGIIPGPQLPIVRKLYRSRWYYGLPFLAEIRTLTLDETFRDKWYPRHLKANTLLMYRVLNMDPMTHKKKSRHMARLWGKAARRIYKGDPMNPLYRLLYEGVTEDLVIGVLETFTHSTKPRVDLDYRDWGWQRHTEERAWERSDGHDQIYLINLILAKIGGKLNW